MRKLALTVVAVLVAVGLAACGGSGSGKKTTSTSMSTGLSPAASKAQIKSAYVKFFSSRTALSQRVALLQNGEQFKPIIEGLAKNPLASNTSATVSSVTLKDASDATVVYSVSVSGTAIPQLKNRTGTAVKENGTWKVGDESFCALVGLGGKAPPACKQS